MSTRNLCFRAKIRKPTDPATYLPTYLPTNLPPTYTQPTYLPIQQPTYLPSNLPTSIQTHLPISPVTYLPVCLPINIRTYIHTYLLTNTYITLLGSFLSYPTLLFLVPIKVRFGLSWSLFRSVSVPTKVRFGTHRSPFRYFRRSVSVSRDTGHVWPFSTI